MTRTAGNSIHTSARWLPNSSGQKTILRCGRASPARRCCCTQRRAFSAAPKRLDWQAISNGPAPKPYPAQDIGFSTISRTKFFPLSENFSELVLMPISGAPSRLSFGTKYRHWRRRSLGGGGAYTGYYIRQSIVMECRGPSRAIRGHPVDAGSVVFPRILLGTR